MMNQGSETGMRLADRGGFVMPVVIFALMILGTVGIAALLTANDEQRSSRAVRESGMAFYTAEAGYNKVLATWPDSLVDLLLPGDSLDLGWETLDNGASFRAMIYRFDNGAAQEIYGMVVEGRGAGPLGGQRTVALAGTSASIPILGSALFGKDSVYIKGPGPVIGDVGSNGDINIDSLALPNLVQGNASAGGLVSNQGVVTGTITEGAPPITFPDIDCPSIPYGPPPTGDPSGIDWDPSTGVLDLRTSTDKFFTSGVYYFHDLLKGGDGQMIVAAGDTIDIFIDGTMQLTGDGFNNMANEAENVQIWACGTDTSDWKIHGDNTTWATVYAPRHHLLLKGDGDRIGSYVAQSIHRQGSGTVAFDDVADSPVIEKGYIAVPGSMMQVSR